MSNSNGNYWSSSVMIDIDGTIANSEWRNNYPNKFDSDVIINDKPFLAMRDVVKSLSQYCRIVYMTGRKEMHRRATLNWLDTHKFPLYPEFDTLLFMRANNDNRSQELVKYDFYQSLVKQNQTVVLVIDDNNDVLEVFRHRNIPVIDSGAFTQFERSS
jgi:hypothetical protein